MKSISTMPPAAYFRSQTSSSPFSSAMARRISATSLATPAASRGRVSTSRMMPSISGAKVRRRRNHPRAGQRHVLPGPGLALLVFGERFDVRGHRAGAPRGAQPHIDLVEHAVIGPRRKGADQPLGEAREIMRALQRPRAVGIRLLGIEIIEQDQIEIGRGGHLAAAEPAHREDRGLLPLDPAVLGREPVGHQAMHGMDDALGDVGEGDAGLLGGDRAGQDARADQEQAFLAEQPQAIEKLFVGIRVRQRRRQPRRQFALVRHRAEEARIDQPVHDLRLPRQHVAEAAARRRESAPPARRGRGSG